MIVLYVLAGLVLVLIVLMLVAPKGAKLVVRHCCQCFSRASLSVASFAQEF